VKVDSQVAELDDFSSNFPSLGEWYDHDTKEKMIKTINPIFLMKKMNGLTISWI